MLEKKYRLPAQIHLVRPTSFTTPYFILKVSSNTLPYSRFGFVVSRKIDTRATVRNRAKRVLRSCIEQMREQIGSGYDMLFLLRKSIVGEQHTKLCSTIETLFKEKGLMQ